MTVMLNTISHISYDMRGHDNLSIFISRAKPLYEPMRDLSRRLSQLKLHEVDFGTHLDSRGSDSFPPQELARLILSHVTFLLSL